MNIRKNARLTPVRREEMSVSVIGWHLSRAQAARAYGVSLKTVAKWARRFQQEGGAGMVDRSSRPRTVYVYRPAPAKTVEQIIALRHQRLCGKHVAVVAGVSAATVSRVLKRAGLSRLKNFEPGEPVIRYEYDEPGVCSGWRRNRIIGRSRPSLHSA